MTEDIIEEVSIKSDAAEEIQDILRESYLDTEFDCKWLPVKIQLVHNEALNLQFEEKKQECLIRGRTAEELEERYGFVVENSVGTLRSLCSIGLCAHDSDYNSLGYNCMGVYLCCHADVCLRHAFVKYSGSPVIRLVICRYMMGQHTTAIPRVSSSADFIQPTQGFDCHVSVIPPSVSDSLQNQFDRSQVYLYDINKLLQPSLRPRQVIPYAVVTYTLNGVQHATVDVEPQSSDISPQLQHIIQQINAKGDSVAGFTALNFESFSHQSETHSIPTISSMAVGQSRPVSGEESNDGGEAHLQRVIAQINARLEAQERSKQMAIHQVASGNIPISMMNQAADAFPIPTRVATASTADGSGGSSLGGVPLGSFGGMVSRVDSAAFGLAAVSGASCSGLDAYIGSMSSVIHPKVPTIGSSNMAATGYVGLAAAGRSAQFTMTPQDLVSLPGVYAASSQQYSSTQPLLHASPYIRQITGAMDTATLGFAGYDPSASIIPRLKYVPYASGVGAGKDAAIAVTAAGGFYPFQTVLPAESVGGSYALVNSSASGAGIKRPLNDVMLYMVDKKPRFY